MHKALHPIDDIDYVSRKKEGRGLCRIENWMDGSIQGLKDYIKKNKERLITVASNSNDNIRTNGTATKTRKQKWAETLTLGNDLGSIKGLWRQYLFK